MARTGFFLLFPWFFIGVTLSFSIALSFGEEPSIVLARVNKIPITSDDVEEEISRIISRTLYHRDASPERREAFRKEAIERLVEKELEYQEAKKQGITVEKEKVEERVKGMKKRFPSEKAFEDALRKSNLTMTKYEERIEKEFLIEKIVRAEVDDKAKVGDYKVKEYYEKNRDKYREPEKIKIRHIMIMFDPSKGVEDKERAKDKAGVIHRRAKAGEDFEALAHEYSEDAYKAKGGELGYVERERMDPAIEKDAFSAAMGEILGPIETEFGFYLIKIEDKKPERQILFDEMKEKIRKQLEDRKKEERKTEWIRYLREKAVIEYQ